MRGAKLVIAGTKSNTPTRKKRKQAASRASALRAGLASLSMICDRLSARCNIVYKPQTCDRAFSWATAPAVEDATSHVLDSPFPATETLYILSAANWEQTLANNPGTWGILALMPGEPVPKNLKQSDAATRIIVLYSKDAHTTETPMAMLSYLQSMFFNLYKLRASTGHIIDSGGKMQTLLDLYAPFLASFVNVTGPTFNLLAYTQNTDIPGKLTQDLVANGTHTKELLARIEAQGVVDAWRTQTGIGQFDPTPNIPFPFVTKIMREGDTYLGHVVMICTHGAPTQGQIDMFERFADAACDLMQHTSSVGSAAMRGASNPAAAFVSSLLDGEISSPAQIKSQIELLGMAGESELRLVVIDAGRGTYTLNTASLAAKLASALPDDYFFAFGYKSHVVGLMHGDTWDGNFDARDINALRDFCKTNACNGYVSDRFHDIAQVRLAYKQALYARKYQNAIDSELAPVLDGEGGEGEGLATAARAAQAAGAAAAAATRATRAQAGSKSAHGNIGANQMAGKAGAGGADAQTAGRLYFFEDAFCFYLFEFCAPPAAPAAAPTAEPHETEDPLSDALDTTFRDFCMNGTVLDEMAAAAKPDETNDVLLLYYYLFFERKATPVAKALHMHRNNVIYRIGAIERRYALNLSKSETRLRLQTCFLYKIASTEQFRQLIS